MSPWHSRSLSSWCGAQSSCSGPGGSAASTKGSRSSCCATNSRSCSARAPATLLVGRPGVPGPGGAPPASPALVRVAGGAGHRARVAAQDYPKALDVREPAGAPAAPPRDGRAHLPSGPLMRNERHRSRGTRPESSATSARLDQLKRGRAPAGAAPPVGGAGRVGGRQNSICVCFAKD